MFVPSSFLFFFFFNDTATTEIYTLSLHDALPICSLVIDRDTASRLGVAVQDIDNTLGDAFGQRQVSNIYKGLNQYHVVLEVAPEMQRSPEALKSIYVPSNSGKLVPLSAFAHYEPSNTALSVNHQGIFPAITLSFNLAPGASLGPAVDHIEGKRNRREDALMV